MSSTQSGKAARFRSLHYGPTFVIPNPWDVASARMLASLGFQCLATSSAASAAMLGKSDHELSRAEALAHSEQIVNATDLPVSADLENGFGDSPAAVAETIRLAAAAGLAGCTIEDTTGNPDQPLFDFSFAVERVSAAVEAARSLAFPFTLTIRTHSLLFPNGTLDETLRRLHAFEEAGADVLFAPGLPDVASVRTVCSSINKPFNFMVGIPGKSFSVPDLTHAGVRRISLATSLFRAAMTGFLNAVHEIKDRGTFSFLDHLVSTPEVVALTKP